MLYDLDLSPAMINHCLSIAREVPGNTVSADDVAMWMHDALCLGSIEETDSFADMKAAYVFARNL